MLSSLRKRFQKRTAAKEERARPDGDDAVRRGGPVRQQWRRFRRATDRYRLLTDVLGGIALVVLVLGSLGAATGGMWPPLVVVESGSMMHAVQETGYGRLGTIDVGDIVFVKRVDGPEDVTTWAEGGELHYRRPGDVIAYWPDGDRDTTNRTSPTTMVIHRAIAYIEVSRDFGNEEYLLYWTDGEVRRWGPEGIYFPPLGFDESSPLGFSPQDGYKPGYSGFVTKGDNAFTNPLSDQALGITRLVEPTWIEAEVYGEIPWMGLGKLALTSGRTNPAVNSWERIGNAYAPLELWTMFFVTISLIVIVPLSLDTYRAWRRLKHEQEASARLEEENRRAILERRAAEKEAAQKRIVSFAQVVSARPLRPPPQGGPGPPGR